MWLILLIALVAVVGVALYNSLVKDKERGEAKLGPDGTNVDPPETFVVHHEGKGQGLDIANTALKDRTENPQRDLPGNAHEVRGARIPGRDAVAMDRPPSDVSAYGDEKVAPGQAGSGLGQAAPDDVLEAGESKEKVLSEGPIGSRPETPEEPGSPYAMGRRVTEIQQSIEAAAELLPDLTPGHGTGRARNVRSPGEVGLGDTAQADDQDDQVLFTPAEDLRDSDVRFEAAQELIDQDWSLLGDEAMPPLGAEGVVAMVKDPHSLYVYWGGLQEDEPAAGSFRTLRIYDKTGLIREYRIGEGVDHWWVNDLPDGRTYYAEVGRFSPPDEYTALGRTGLAATPHAQPEAAHPLFGTQMPGPGASPGGH